ncbi:MAG: hypothetical protein ACYC3F_01125 [Gemmatimonadaceae bacterium]
MNLSANVWPVVDAATGFVLRFLMRAYALDASDEVISRTLRALAPTDYLMARPFPVPQCFVMTSEHGTISGCVTIRTFHLHQGAIIEEALRSLEDEFAALQGIDVRDGQTIGVALSPRFPPDPYFVVTSLLETEDGRLAPVITAS